MNTINNQIMIGKGYKLDSMIKTKTVVINKTIKMKNTITLKGITMIITINNLIISLMNLNKMNILIKMKE